jgi:hypothetical protein
MPNTRMGLQIRSITLAIIVPALATAGLPPTLTSSTRIIKKKFKAMDKVSTDM